VGGICNLVLFMGLFAMSVSSVGADGGSANIKYPINVACECIFTLYVDGVYVGEGNKENYDPVNWPFGRSEWNNTKKYYPVIYENEPKVVAFNGIGGQYTVFPNGFIMDMNDGNDYTEYKEWKCKDFSKTTEKSPPANWFTYDYDDSGWDISTSYGANYQNNSFQIFESPRDFISLNAEWLWTKDNADANIYCRKKNMDTVVLTSAPPVTTSAAPPATTTVTRPPATTTVTRPPVTTTVTHPPATTTVTHPPATTSPPVSKTIHHHMRTHPHITSTAVPPPATTTTTVTHPPATTTTTVTHPPATTTTTVTHTPATTTTTVTHTPATTTTTVMHPPATTTTVTHPPATTSAPVSKTIHQHMRTHPHITSTAVPPPVTTTVTHPPATTSAPVSKTIHQHMRTHQPATTTVTHPPTTTSAPVTTATVTHPPATTIVTHPPATTSAPVSTTIHQHMRTHPHITSTAVPPPVTTVLTRPLAKTTTTVTHPPATTSTTVSKTIHHHMRTSPPVSLTSPPSPPINIKIIINNIKYSQGISDKQLAHLLENIKFYNHPQYQSKYRNDPLDNNNLYRTVLNARLDLIRHYEVLLRHFERLERLEHESRDEDTDYKIPRHSSDDSTSKSNIIQSMIKLNSRIKHIEDSIHFIKGNHKYLLLHILKNLKQQYKEDTMKIFNI